MRRSQLVSLCWLCHGASSRVSAMVFSLGEEGRVSVDRSQAMESITWWRLKTFKIVLLSPSQPHFLLISKFSNVRITLVLLWWSWRALAPFNQANRQWRNRWGHWDGAPSISKGQLRAIKYSLSSFEKPRSCLHYMERSQASFHMHSVLSCNFSGSHYCAIQQMLFACFHPLHKLLPFQGVLCLPWSPKQLNDQTSMQLKMSLSYTNHTCVLNLAKV